MAEKTEKTVKNDTVRMRIPRERRDQEDKVVWVNARRYVIQRGVDVDVPAAVAEVLRHEEEMLRKAYEYEQQQRDKIG